MAKRLRSQIDAGAASATTNTAGTATVGGVNLKMRGKGAGESANGNVNGNPNNNGPNSQTLLKKPRARQALAYANVVPSSGSSRSGSGGSNSGNNSGGGKSNVASQGQGVITRRSSRLLSSVGLGGAVSGKVGLKVCVFIELYIVLILMCC